MQIFIHKQEGSFSDRWIEWCGHKNIEFTIVNCFDVDIISRINKGDVLLWHWEQNDIRALTFARHIIAALQEKGANVFPDIRICWHYDDKVAQKYLLESIGAPLIPTYIFYDKKEAKEWIKQASFPKVFKLRRGAGSANVKLVKNVRSALELCDIAFAAGFNPQPGYFNDANTKIRKIKNTKSLFEKLQRFPHVAISNYLRRGVFPKERGYIYFQDFLANNNFDTRVTVIGNKAFGFIRQVRVNDFRASGSGVINYDPKGVDHRCLKIAFDVARKLSAKSLAFDFLYGRQNEVLIGEISYCYLPELIHNCPGYWKSDFIWVDGHFFPQDLIIGDMVCEYNS